MQPFFSSAFYKYTGLNQGLQINYQGVGSGAGITAFQSGTVAFAASDVPMSSSDLAKMPANSGPVVQIPDILGGVAIAYNLPGVSTRIKLDGPTLAGIFDGTITTWNAPQITALNPGVSLPSHAITPEVRADSSGTTYIFTDYLAVGRPVGVDPRHVEDDRLAVGGGPDPEELGGGLRRSSPPRTPSGTSSSRTPSQNKMSYAAVKNAAGVYVVPSPATVAADADQKTAVSSTDFSIVNQAGATSYPIAGYSWAILLQKQTSATTGLPGGQGPRLDDPHRRWPGPGALAPLRGPAAGRAEPEPDAAADRHRTQRPEAAHQVIRPAVAVRRAPRP